MSDEPHPGDVEEVLGAPLTRVQAIALIGLGVVSLLMVGVQSELLGALADERRLDAAGVGVAATLEALAMALTVGGASVGLRPHRLRLWGFATVAVLVAATAATIGARGAGVYAARTAAGAAEGLMLWLASSMIARTQTPERWAAAMFLALSFVSLAIAALLGAVTLPRFGADGGYALMGGVSLVGLVFAGLSPSRLGPLPGADGDSRGAPPARGWIGLGGTLAYAGAIAAVSVYLVPLAEAAGLTPNAARLALSAGLAAQILGSVLAATLAGRVGWFAMLGGTTVAYLGVWAFYLLPGQAWPFAAATAVSGVVAMFVPPFLLPMLIQADPSRRAALQSAAAQLAAAALGPLAASWAVGAGGMRLMLLGCAGALLAGLAVFAFMRFTTPRRAVVLG